MTYTDEYGAFEGELEPLNSVEFSSILSEKQKFFVELYAGTQEVCIGKDGRLGGTGEGDVPRVLFSWD